MSRYFVLGMMMLVAFGAWAEQLVSENDGLRYAVEADGRNGALVGKASGVDLLENTAWSCASIVKGGQTYPASQVIAQDGDWRVTFGASGVEAVLRPRAEKTFLTLEVVSVSGEGVHSLTFLNAPIKKDPALVACCLALNLKTNVPELPGPMNALAAMAYRRFGFEGAKVAIIVSPPDTLREIMKGVVSSSDEIPRSALGGPWALEAPIARGSYLIDIDAKLGEATVDDHVALAKNMGLQQIDFHTGKTMRFGDLVPDPKWYPHGLDGVKAVVDKLHAQGIQAGLHTYAFFIAKDSEWVSPKPDPRLAVAREFSLAQAVDAQADTLPLSESPEGVTPVTGFQVRNSATVRIDDELITFEGVRAEPPYALTGCKRGVHGTAAAPHAPTAKVAQLKECFGLFTPDGDSSLFAEVAARTADVYNRCGFDMIYLDALDGSDILGGGENGWYYAARFVFELNKRLERPALFEMSTFTHNLWYARTRMGAWDVPARAFNRYVDIHTLANRDCAKMFMPAHLGWWGLFDWSPVQPERMFPEDIEYLCAKSLAFDSSLSFLVGFTPESWAGSSNVRRMGGLIRQYETLRLTSAVPEATRAALGKQGQAFELVANTDTSFRPVRQAKHVIDGEGAAAWTVANAYSAQEPRIRIEALMSAAPYDAPDAIELANFVEQEEFAERSAQTGVTAAFTPAEQPGKDALPSAAFEATSGHAEPASAWAQATKTFPSLMDLNNKALGVWINGDGQGEVLNIQLKNPAHINSAISDHYVTIDFTGWQYRVLVEPESDRIGQYGWPYSARQDLDAGKPLPFGDVLIDYNMWVDYGQIGSINLLLNNLPVNKPVRCMLSPIRALPLKAIEIVNPSVTVAGQTIVFPVTLKTGQYIECRSVSDCTVYDEQGEPIATITPKGNVPALKTGDNPVQFSCDPAPAGAPPTRARVTVTTAGEVLAVK